VILHVRDISAAHAETQKQDVEAVLQELGIDPAGASGRIIEVWNKADLLSEDARAALANKAGRDETSPVLVSAHTGEGIPALLERLAAQFNQPAQAPGGLVAVAH